MNTLAFPITGSHESVIETGLTKRELFAAMAMQALASRDGGNPDVNITYDVPNAVAYADALLAELAKAVDQ